MTTYLDPICNAIAEDRELTGAPFTWLDYLAVLAVLKGKDVTPQEMHLAWSVWCRRFNPTSPLLRPYEELGALAHGQYDLYIDVIKRVTAGLADVPRETSSEGQDGRP
jgi:hypothetical protein